MKLNYILLSLTAVLLVAAGCNKAVTKTNITPPPISTQTTKETTTVDADGGKETPELMAKEKAEYEKTYPNEQTEGKTERSSYKDYSAETVAAEQKAGKKVVLFFHAKWCPECRAADAAFLAHPEAIPSGVVVLKTDYDTNSDLKKRYGVVYQHTFVQLDTNGNAVTKWNSGDIEQLKRNIK